MKRLLIFLSLITVLASLSSPAYCYDRYGVLISGKIDKEEFWYDTVIMHDTLQQYGYKDENIFTLFAWGNDNQIDEAGNQTPNPRYRREITDFSATRANVETVFNGLRQGDATNNIPQMTNEDILYVWTFDHGRPVRRVGYEYEERPPWSYDLDSELGLIDGWITDEDFASLVDAIPYAYRMFAMQQCRSGGFIDDLVDNPNTVIMTACREEDKYAYRADDYPTTENEIVNNVTYYHGEFNYHLMNALSGKTPTNNLVDADTNNDGRVSLQEASNYVADHDSWDPRSQNPADHYWDRTDGILITVPAGSPPPSIPGHVIERLPPEHHQQDSNPQDLGNRLTLAGPFDNVITLTAGNQWSIDIDPYGRSQFLKYIYSPSSWVNEIYDWAGHIHYDTPEGSKSIWLYDASVFTQSSWDKPEPIPPSERARAKVEEMQSHWPYIDEAVADVCSIIESDELRVEIWSGVFSWADGSKYTLFQDYKFTNKTAESSGQGYDLTNFRYIQYIDPDIGENRGSNDYGYAPAWNLPRGNYPPCALWLLNESAETTPWDRWRGYGFTCVGWPQPDTVYRHFYTNYSSGIPTEEGCEVGYYRQVKANVESDSLTPGPGTYYGDVAGALRWSRIPKERGRNLWDSTWHRGELVPITLTAHDRSGTWWDDREVTISTGLYVVPEPCTMLLMGSGLAGLAGLARRRKKVVEKA